MSSQVAAELVAVVIGVDDDVPVVLATDDALPHGPLEPAHRSLQAGVRAWVAEQSAVQLGYVEQLYTFADAGRLPGETTSLEPASSDQSPSTETMAPGRTAAPHEAVTSGRTVAISYLGLTRATSRAQWMSIYSLFPWEDRRGADAALDDSLAAALQAWAGVDAEARARVAYTFGLDGEPWQPDLVLQRYELLWEAGLVAESVGAAASGGAAPAGVAASAGVTASRGAAESAGATAASAGSAHPATGRPMVHDHRRILATGLARLRSTLQYRPLIFELLPEEFTLGHLQATVEALAGRQVHKPNFRRLVLQQAELVEPTGRTSKETGGRPARLYSYRRAVHAERRHVGTKLPRPKVR